MFQTEEQEYLSHYSIADFERPSLATDIAIFSIQEEQDRENFRKLSKMELKILLIQRDVFPYKSCWALPGGFCVPGEDVAETARRELFEETNVNSAYLQLDGVYGEMGRDPRGWIISNAFLALIDGTQQHIHGGSDAWEARWFNITLEQREVHRQIEEARIFIETENQMNFWCEETDLSFSTIVREYKVFEKYHESVKYEIVENGQLAFDHAKIILSAFLSLRKKAEADDRILFDLMPEFFTLTQLQTVFEIVLDRKLITPNFRRKILPYVTETDRMVEGEGHRPAKLFQRNLGMFYR
ncbi:MAG: NUDIX domain-containing protein [Lachnospiraceae bacterium]|nr:NUDIX hydrolase [Robinsoniella sp.]MDY3765101.1 NUDIX domain-containing protein [Lachnospiraceae bacterium]